MAARRVLAVTDPVGLTTVSTYNESTNQPVHVGDYSVRTTVDDAMYSGSTTGLFSIVQGTPGLSLSNPGDQLATAEVILTATSSCPLEIAYTLNSGPAVLQGNVLSFTNAGTITVSAVQSGDTNWLAATSTVSFAVSKAPAVLVFSGLSPTYDGGEHGVTAHTVPAGLPVQLTYAGAAEPPVNAGSLCGNWRGGVGDLLRHQ